MTHMPEFYASQWFNTDTPLNFGDFRGKVLAVETPGDVPTTRATAAWGLQGTSTLVLSDRTGRMRARHFGQVADLALGAQNMQLIHAGAGADRRAERAAS
jgi:hypothetical protein